MIKGIILDSDGLLVDTEDLKLEVLNSILERHSSAIARDKYYSQYAGNGEIDFVGGIIKEYKLPVNAQDFLEEKRKLYFQLLMRNRSNILISGVPAFLQKIRSMKIPMAIATGSTKKEMELLLPVIGTELIKEIVTQEDVNFQKPNPEIYLKAAEKLGIKPSNLMILEDSFRPLIEAKKHGFATVLVNGGFNGIPEGVDHSIKRLGDFNFGWLKTGEF